MSNYSKGVNKEPSLWWGKEEVETLLKNINTLSVVTGLSSPLCIISSKCLPAFDYCSHLLLFIRLLSLKP